MTTPKLEVSAVPKWLVPKVFSEILPELQDCLEKSGGWADAEGVFEAIVSDRMQLYRGEIDGEYAGFMVLEAWNSGEKGWYLNVPWAHTNPKFYPDIDVAMEALGEVEALARKLGFSGTMVTSKRRGMGRRAKQFGYEEDITRYVKEFD